MENLKWKLPNKLRTTQVEASTLGSSGWVVTNLNIIGTQNLSWSSPSPLNQPHSAQNGLNSATVLTYAWLTLPVTTVFFFFPRPNWTFYGLVTIALVNNNNKLSRWVILDVTGCFVVYVTLWFRSKQMEDTFRASSKIRTFYRVV